MPFFRKAAQLAALAAALAVVVFVVVTALKQPTPPAVPDVRANPMKAVFPDEPAKKEPALPAPPTPAPKVFGIAPGRRTGLGEGGPVDPRP